MTNIVGKNVLRGYEVDESGYKVSKNGLKWVKVVVHFGTNFKISIIYVRMLEN